MATPRYRLISGDFYILYPDLPRNGPEPDGDTISFLPDQDDLVQALPRFSRTPPERKHLGVYSVRFEGIDALETHFENHHQDLGFAAAARDLMLHETGATRVTILPDLPTKVESASPHPLPGYVLATGIEANGRIVAQVHAGEPDRAWSTAGTCSSTTPCSTAASTPPSCAPGWPTASSARRCRSR